MAQQTAVEFLIESIDADARGLWTKELRKKAEQAKQMEREQIEQAFGAGNSTVYDWDDSSKKRYYNETYGTRLQNETNSTPNKIPPPPTPPPSRFLKEGKEPPKRNQLK